MALHPGLLVEGALPPDAGATPPFSPNYPAPVLFTCLGCRTVREARVCDCGQDGCFVCHVAGGCPAAQDIVWRERIRRPDDQPAPVLVRRVGIRRA